MEHNKNVIALRYANKYHIFPSGLNLLGFKLYINHVNKNWNYLFKCIVAT